jgi:steroid delta-isomerase-like uncharacterized protein
LRAGWRAKDLDDSALIRFGRDVPACAPAETHRQIVTAVISETSTRWEATMSIEENKAIAQRFYAEVINGGSDPALEELVSPDYVDRLVVGVPPSLDAFRDFLRMVATAFPDIEVTVEDMLAEGDRVAARVTVRGTHLGPLFGQAPTGKPAVFAGVDVLRIAGGQVVERWSVRDLLGMLRQLGLSA